MVKFWVFLIIWEKYCAQIAVGPPTCPADGSSGCGDSDEWEGEFFPGIPNIKYEVIWLFDYDFSRFYPANNVITYQDLYGFVCFRGLLPRTIWHLNGTMPMK